MKPPYKHTFFDALRGPRAGPTEAPNLEILFDRAPNNAFRATDEGSCVGLWIITDRATGAGAWLFLAPEEVERVATWLQQWRPN